MKAAKQGKGWEWGDERMREGRETSEASNASSQN